MNGARWGWIAFIGAIAILFTASSYDQSSNNKTATLLRQELKTTLADRDHAFEELHLTQDAAAQSAAWAEILERTVQQSQEQLKIVKSERDKLRKELTALSLDRNQLQQAIASLHLERSQTKRTVEQLRQGLQQLITQADSVAAVLAAPAPGFAQIQFDEEVQSLPKLAPLQPDASTYYPEALLNKHK